MAANKHLVLDASVILDLWLRPERAMATEALFASAEQGRTSLWVSAASLPTLEFVAVRRCKEQGIDPTVARSLVKRLMLDLLNRVRVLSNRGYEQAELYAKSTDFEDAQLAASARSISAGQVCMVSSDAAFDALAEFSFQRAEQALHWLLQESPALNPARTGGSLLWLALVATRCLKKGTGTAYDSSVEPDAIKESGIPHPLEEHRGEKCERCRCDGYQPPRVEALDKLGRLTQIAAIVSLYHWITFNTLHWMRSAIRRWRAPSAKLTQA